MPTQSALQEGDNVIWRCPECDVQRDTDIKTGLQCPIIECTICSSVFRLSSKPTEDENKVSLTVEIASR